MRIARFSHQDAIKYGIVDERELVVLAGDPMFAGYDTTGERVPLGDVALLAPVIPRSKVIAVGRNYRDHAAEFDNDVPAEPMLFFKPNTSVIGPDDAIVLPPQSERIDVEGELAVVMGRIAKNVAAENALDYVFGYTNANDVTARDLQRRDGQWARAKGFDTFCPLGPSLAVGIDPTDLRIWCRVDGELRQDGTTADLVFGLAHIVSFVSHVMTLQPGDVIATGTPAGVGPLLPGQTCEVGVHGVGVLRNPVVARADRT